MGSTGHAQRFRRGTGGEGTHRENAVGMRAGLLALAGAFLFLFALLCTIALLAESDCGERFGYYGCDLQH
jgi:hypothetical protein